MELVVVAIAGFFAAMVDGALGMGFGPTSAAILLSAGVSPAAASASVNIAKVATGLAGALAHWRFNNIDHRLVLKLAIPGAIGALVGTTVLANVDGDQLRPWLALLLLLVGIRILVRFSKRLPKTAPVAEGEEDKMPAFNQKGVEVVGAAGGVTNGLIGAWGPVVTPFLLHRGLPGRFAVGCVNTAEVAVAVVSVGSLITALGKGGIEWGVVLAMLIGGVLAAPLAAFLVRRFPPRLMGIAVGGLLLFTQTRELATTTDLLPGNRWFAYPVIPIAVLLAVFLPRLRKRWQRRRAATTAAVEGAPRSAEVPPA